MRERAFESFSARGAVSRGRGLADLILHGLELLLREGVEDAPVVRRPLERLLPDAADDGGRVDTHLGRSAPNPLYRAFCSDRSRLYRGPR